MNREKIHLVSLIARQELSRSVARIIVLLGLAGALLVPAESVPWRIVPPNRGERRLPEMPPLAVVASWKGSEPTWPISGRIAGTRAVAASDFKICFERQGWRLDKVIPAGRDKRGTVLYLWRRADLGIILMLWESEVAETGFAVGLDHKQQEKQLKQ